MEMVTNKFIIYAIPYLFGVGFLLSTEINWMNEELTLPTEGHEVAKVFLVYFFVYLHAFINLGMQTGSALIASFEMCTSCHGLKIHSSLQQLSRICCSILFTKVGTALWKHVLFFHVCETYHHRSHRYNIGRLAAHLKRMVCAKERLRKSVTCQRYLDHFPLFLFGLFFILMGHVIFPYLNDFLLQKKLSRRMKAKLQKRAEIAKENGFIQDYVKSNDGENNVPLAK